jgi:hypothetical protein
MFYDPDFSLLLGGGGDADDPCAEQDLFWTWMCLGFLLADCFFLTVFVIAATIVHKYKRYQSRAYIRQKIKEQNVSNMSNTSVMLSFTLCFHSLRVEDLNW